jgi:hypothetical protein
VQAILGSIDTSGILLARDTRGQRNVVIKVYSSMARYATERDAYAAVRTPGHVFFPEIYEDSPGDEDTPPMMVMQYGEVGLRARMDDKTRASMTLPERRLALYQVGFTKSCP